MNSRDFSYWLQGFFEIADASEISDLQLQIIKDHLALAIKTTETPISTYAWSYTGPVGPITGGSWPSKPVPFPEQTICLAGNEPAGLKHVDVPLSSFNFGETTLISC